IKMINSTSTTSTSGVMLISDCRLEPESLFNCMTSISLRAGALGDQPHSTEPGLLGCDHRFPYLLEVEPGIGADYDFRFGRGAHRRGQSVAELLGRDLMIVDPQLARIVDGDQYPASLVALFVRFRRVRKVDVRSPTHRPRDLHKYDQQHQHHVHKRRDVDGRL